MPVPNPEYNPDWEAVHKFHHGEFERWGEIVTRGYQNSDCSAEFREAHAKQEEHHHAMLDSYRMQFPTIQEHAKWVFDSFHPDVVRGERVVVHIPDFEEFKTHEDINAAYSAVRAEAERVVAEREHALPIAEIPGTKAFQAGGENPVISYWRHFQEPELYPAGRGLGANISTLITAHQVGNKFHICFMHDHDHSGLGAVNGVELIANVIYREAVKYAKDLEEQNPQSFLRTILSAAAGKKNLPKPDDFHFYVHIPPNGGSFGREAFIEVGLSHNVEHFYSPEWDHKEFIPEAVKLARVNTMKTFTPNEPIAITQMQQSPSAPSPI